MRRTRTITNSMSMSTSTKSGRKGDSSLSVRANRRASSQLWTSMRASSSNTGDIKKRKRSAKPEKRKRKSYVNRKRPMLLRLLRMVMTTVTSRMANLDGTEMRQTLSSTVTRTLMQCMRLLIRQSNSSSRCTRALEKYLLPFSFSRFLKS